MAGVAHRDARFQALKVYAASARSADKGATRDPELIDKLSGLASIKHMKRPARFRSTGPFRMPVLLAG